MNHWERIVREHGPMAISTAFRILGNQSDAQDAVQDAFLNALQIRRKGTVANWGALLRHLATCRALDLLRKRRTGAFEPAGDVAQLAASSASQPVTLAVAHEDATLLRNAVADLPEREAQVFSLRYFAGLSNPEIAQTLEITATAVEVALSKARTRLQTLFDAKE